MKIEEMNFMSRPISEVQHWASDAMNKRVYNFTEGTGDDFHRLGLKGANLCELSRLGLPVPPGFIITTDTCTDFFKGTTSMPAHLMDSWLYEIGQIENLTGRKFGLTSESPLGSIPLLFSVRSGAPVDMPSMMDSLLNVGINDEVVQRLISNTANPKFALDLHRRFLQMYGTIVMKIPKEKYLNIIEEERALEGVALESDLGIVSLQNLIRKFKEVAEVPSDPYEQLRRSIEAIFCSFYSPRAVRYRQLRNISEDIGTAVIIQSMVYGNLNPKSCTGKMITRNPDTGENALFGEFLCSACGDDLVEKSECAVRSLDKMEDWSPHLMSELKRWAKLLENSFRDAQEIEFTVESGEIFILETVPARRSSEASVRIAVDMVRSGILSEREGILGLDAKSMHFFTHPSVGSKIDDSFEVIGTGLATSAAGAASGVAVFNSDDAIKMSRDGRSVILIRNDSSSDDAPGIAAADGIITMHGGLMQYVYEVETPNDPEGITSAAAEIARTFDKPAIVGLSTGGLSANLRAECVYDFEGNVVIEKGQEITLDAYTGRILNGHAPTIVEGAKGSFKTLMRWADSYRRTALHVCVDSAHGAKTARDVRPDGIGLLRTGKILKGSESIHLMRGLAFSNSETVIDACYNKLEKVHFEDLQDIFAMATGSIVSVELNNDSIDDYWCPEDQIKQPVPEAAVADLHQMFEMSNVLWEKNPVLGGRGCRCALMHPQFARMQTRAILMAGCSLMRNKTPLFGLDIIVPSLTSEHELQEIVSIINNTANEVFEEIGFSLTYRIGAKIETPRACLRAQSIAQTEGVAFALFDMDRLTELVLGMSKEDSKCVIQAYIKQGIIHKDPFNAIDKRGVGALISAAVRQIRKGNVKFPIGMFGNQCGHTGTIDYFSGLAIDYFCCEVQHIPTVKIATAQAYIKRAKAYERTWLGGDTDEDWIRSGGFPFLM